MRIAQSDEEVIVAMPVHERRLVRSNLNFEDANLFILKSRMVGRFGGDLHLGGVLRKCERRGNKNERNTC